MEAVSQKLNPPLNVHGKALLSNLDFWYFLNAYVSIFFWFFLFIFSFHILDYKNSSWDWIFMYVLYLSKVFTGNHYSFDLDINNVSTMSRSLYAHNNPEYDNAHALKWQAAQVSVFSLTNFGGRLSIGYSINRISLITPSS